MIWRKRGLALLGAVCSVAGGAEPVAPAADFGPGFEKLAALGMPALGADAVWSASRESGNASYQVRQFASSLKGSAWSVPSSDGKFRLLPMGVPAFLSESVTKAPKPADLDEEVGLLIAGLEKAAANSSDHDPFGYRRDSSAGTLLLFATQLHQTGRKELANKLALALFRASNSREVAVDAAVSALADHFYQESALALLASGDWAAWHRSLVDLMKRFPRGWHDAEAVAMMLPQLAKQAAGEKPAALALPGIPLDPEALAAVSALMEKPPEKPSDAKTSRMTPREMAMMEYRLQRGFESKDLWLLGNDSEADEEDEQSGGSPFDALTKLRMKAVPVLAAMLDDPHFTLVPNSSSRSGYYSSSDSSEERVLRSYQNLTRPLTRGEIAARLLAATLPDPEDELLNADPATLRDLAVSFWKEHKDDSPSQLAAVFLTEGDEEQSATAGDLLAKSSAPEDQKLFETHVLASENAINVFQSVQAYLRNRKSAAKPFYEAYAKLVRSQKSEGEDQDYERNSWMVREAGGADKILKQMESLVGGQSPKAFAVQVAKGDPKQAEEGVRAIAAMIADSSSTKQLYTWLEGANAAKDAGVRARFLMQIMEIEWPMSVDEDTKSAERKIIDAEAIVWRKLIADEREIPKEAFERGSWWNAARISDIASMVLEYSVNPREMESAGKAGLITGKTIFEIFGARASARLGGQPVPAFPDGSRVPKERLEEIVKQAGGKPPGEIQPYLSTLGVDERAAWFDWLSSGSEEVAVPESVGQLRRWVVARGKDSMMDLPPLEDTGILKPGFVLSAESLKTCLESIAEKASDHSREVIQLWPTGFGPGLEVIGCRVPLPDKPNPPDDNRSPFEDAGDDGTRFLSSSINAFENDASAEAVIVVELDLSQEPSTKVVWLVLNGGLKPANPDTLKEFEGKFAKISGPEAGAIHVRFQVLSKADALKFKKSEEESSELPDLPQP